MKQIVKIGIFSLAWVWIVILTGYGLFEYVWTIYCIPASTPDLVQIAIIFTFAVLMATLLVPVTYIAERWGLFND